MAGLLPGLAPRLVAVDGRARLPIPGERMRRLDRRCGGRFAVDQPMQKVENMRLCRSTVAERQLNGTQHSLFIVMQNERQYLHHLPVAPRLLEKMLLQPP